MNIESEKKIQIAVAHKKEKSDFQKVLDVPVIGEIIGLFVGLVPPLLLEMVVNYHLFGSSKGESNFIFAALMFFWNLLLFLAFRILTTAPILPIPLFVIGFILCIVEVVKYFLS